MLVFPVLASVVPVFIALKSVTYGHKKRVLKLSKRACALLNCYAEGVIREP
jgi:hypothetical protein